MSPIDYLVSLLLLLPRWVALPPIFIFLAILLLNFPDYLTRLGITKNRLTVKKLFIIFTAIIIIYFVGALPMLLSFRNTQEDLKSKVNGLNQDLSHCRLGTASSNPPQNNGEPPPQENLPLCQDWNQCTNFKNDFGLDNSYYVHTDDDPQVLILTNSGSWKTPPLYFEKECSPFYSFRLDVTPLNSEAANIIIESKEMFQLFIGDGDYRSLAFLKWDQKSSGWQREENSKIFLGRDLNLPDMESKTQFSVSIETRKKAGNAEVTVSITYKPAGGKKEKETATFRKEIGLAAAEPEKITTKVGIGMYHPDGNIPQAKFYFMGLRSR
ncbi:MAG TPA: hypothetical protein VMW04_02845 [Patescibacteria group bacterium]|nr:hypothetical protein [Patescibacteria group bacterium]